MERFLKLDYIKIINSLKKSFGGQKGNLSVLQDIYNAYN